MNDVAKALAKAKNDGFVYRVFGGFLEWVFVILWVISLVMLFTGDGNWVVMIVFFFLIGAFKQTHDKGVVLKTLLEQYELYCKHLQGKPFVSAEDFAVYVSQDEESVIQCLDSMIKHQFVDKVETSADKKKRIVYIRGHAIVMPMPVLADKAKMVAAKCSSCGGITEIPEGESGICEYCGSKIQDEPAN